MSIVRSFQLHGERIRIEAQSEPWADSVDEILGAYRTVEEARDEATIRVALAGEQHPARLPADLELRSRFEDLEFWSTRDHSVVWIDVHGRGWVRVQPEAGEIDARLALDPQADGWLVAHHAFYPALLEVLKERGMFPLHAGLVAQGAGEGAEGLLVCGASGAGKTTLTLALAGKGWSLLGDDTCFLRSRAGGVEGLAFWEDLHVTESTLDRFPALSFLRRQPVRRGNWKRHFGIHELSQLKVAERAPLRWLLFPRVCGVPATVIDPLTGAEAVRRLAPQSMIPIRPAVVAAQLAVLAQLGRTVRAAEVRMGTDLDEVVGVVHTFLALRD